MCPLIFRCLILTPKIASFNSFARWLREEQSTVSAKCLCQSPKQPIPINIKNGAVLLTNGSHVICKDDIVKVKWWDVKSGGGGECKLLAEKGRHLSPMPASQLGCWGSRNERGISISLYERLYSSEDRPLPRALGGFLLSWAEQERSWESHGRRVLFVWVGWVRHGCFSVLGCEAFMGEVLIF